MGKKGNEAVKDTWGIFKGIGGLRREESAQTRAVATSLKIVREATASATKGLGTGLQPVRNEVGARRP